jgi:hypothetical protein
MVFVNYPAFAIHHPGSSERFLVDMFWQQLGWVKPESYIGDGADCLTFVSRNDALFESVHQRLTADSHSR